MIPVKPSYDKVCDKSSDSASGDHRKVCGSRLVSQKRGKLDTLFFILKTLVYKIAGFLQQLKYSFNSFDAGDEKIYQ